MTKTRIIIEIECGKVTCGECHWHRDDDEDGECSLFGGRFLVDGVIRCPECVEGQARADEMMFKTAMAKAAPQS